MENISGHLPGQKNPWLNERHSGSWRNILNDITHTASTVDEDSLSRKHRTSPSLQMIKLQREISHTRRQIEEVKLKIQHQQRNAETYDITDADILEERIKKVRVLIDHLECIVKHKEVLIATLQQPFINDFIPLESAHQRYASEVISMLVPTLTDLPRVLENTDRIGQLEARNTRLTELQTDASAVVSSQKAIYQQIYKLRSAMQRLHAQRMSQDSLAYSGH